LVTADFFVPSTSVLGFERGPLAGILHVRAGAGGTLKETLVVGIDARQLERERSSGVRTPLFEIWRELRLEIREHQWDEAIDGLSRRRPSALR
jgi:hypothetical protein